MSVVSKTRRVGLAARGPHSVALEQLFQHADLVNWDLLPSQSCEHVHYLLQMDACDVLLVDQSFLDEPRDPSLAWMTARPDVPVVFLSDNAPDVVLYALDLGIRQWLPRSEAMAHPSVLAAALRHAAQGRSAHQQAVRVGAELRESRSQVTRLANLLWDAIPGDGSVRWYSQRSMMERLYEEVLRSERHEVPLSVVLGEVWTSSEGHLDSGVPLGQLRGKAGTVGTWAVEQIYRSKRRCDVVGQYGPRGFMLLLPHTEQEGASLYCHRLRGSLALAPAGPGGEVFRLRPCLGVASFSQWVATPKSLLRHAEERLEHERASSIPE